MSAVKNGTGKRRSNRPAFLSSQAVFLALCLAFSLPARANIYEWEYVDPLDPSQGKQQSAVLTPGGSGVNAVPSANLSSLNLTMGYFISADLTGASFLASTLTNADLSSATLTNANLGNATINGAVFDGTAFTKEQLYSTASYASGNLTGVGLSGNDLDGWNFAGQNLTSSNFTSVNLTNANLANANFTSATFVGSDLSKADARGATGMTYTDAAQRSNFIRPDGIVEGLSLGAGETMRIWDDQAASPPNILVQTGFVMDGSSTLLLVFEDADWGSLIQMGAGITVTLGGTLELGLGTGVTPADIGGVGKTFHLFDWTAASAVNGQFSQILLSGDYQGYSWDTGNLYTAGTITMVSIPEPGALSLAALGIALCGGGAIRRRARRS